jgi:predicted nuclease of predicted toxin-antitoxin system
VIKILVDHNLEGQALTLWGALVAEGWLELISAELVRFTEVGLPIDSDDRAVWGCAQANQMILLTNNRNMKGDDSLGQTLREENTPTSLPVITIGNPNRLSEREYRSQCVSRLVEIALDLDNYLGTARIFIP